MIFCVLRSRLALGEHGKRPYPLWVMLVRPRAAGRGGLSLVALACGWHSHLSLLQWRNRGHGSPGTGAALHEAPGHDESPGTAGPGHPSEGCLEGAR